MVALMVVLMDSSTVDLSDLQKAVQMDAWWVDWTVVRMVHLKVVLLVALMEKLEYWLVVQMVVYLV